MPGQQMNLPTLNSPCSLRALPNIMRVHFAYKKATIGSNKNHRNLSASRSVKTWASQHTQSSLQATNTCGRLPLHTKQSAVLRYISKESANGNTQPHRKVSDVKINYHNCDFIPRHPYRTTFITIKLTTCLSMSIILHWRFTTFMRQFTTNSSSCLPAPPPFSSVTPGWSRYQTREP